MRSTPSIGAVACLVFSGWAAPAGSIALDGFGPTLPSRVELEATARAGDDRSRAAALVALAFLEEQGRSPVLAKARFDEAVRTAQQVDFGPIAAQWIASRLSPNTGSWVAGRSAAWLDVAVDGFRILNRPAQLARALRMRATLALRNEDRREFLEQAFAEARLGGCTQDIAAIEGDWGEALRMAGDLAGAIEHLTRSAKTLEETQAWSESAKAYASLARTFALHGQFAQAQTALGSALRGYKEARDAQGLMQARIQQTVLWSATGNRTRALTELSAIRDTLADGQGPPAIRLRLAAVALAYLQLGEYAIAAEIAESVMEEFRNRAPVAAYRVLGIADYHLGLYDRAIKVLTAASQRAGESAFNQREAHRYRALSLSKTGRTKEAASAITEALSYDTLMRGKLAPEDELRLAFDEARAPLAHDAIHLLWRAGRRYEAFAAAEEFRARALMDGLSSRHRRAPVWPATAEQAAALAKRMNANLITYWVHPAAVYSWLISRDGVVRMHRVGIPRRRVNRLVERARRFSTQPDNAAWQELDRILIQPLRHDVSKTTAALAIVPHDALMELPFGALLDDKGRYLAEHYAIRVASGVSLLSLSPNARDTGPILLIGAPVRPPKDGRYRPLPPLPGARLELQDIASRVSGKKVLLGPQAILPNIRNAIGEAGLVHFATHAIVDRGSPRRSFLALSEGDKLTVADVAGLELRAGLVVLSACRGASGPRSPDGLIGFPRAFLLAGAARVIAPLWDVPDEATAVLMAEFYKYYVAGARPSEALRNAQMKLLRDLRAGRVIANTLAGPMTLPAHPSLWAGFVLQGAE